MDILQHYGTPRHSGRYPWGSGDNPYQRTGKFLKDYHDMLNSGMSQKEIAKALGFSGTSELRAKVSIASNNKRKDDIAYALKLKEHGYSNTEIGRRMGINESSVRSLLNPVTQERAKLTDATISALKENVSEKRFIDIGAGAEYQLGVSRDKLTKCINKLKEEGYQVVDIRVDQMGTNHQTTMHVLAPPGMDEKELKRYLYSHLDEVANIENRVDPDSELGQQRSYILPPKSIDSNRIDICYAEDGGADKDGVIELRRGVEDISLGNSQYAQVRIAVDGTHYLKGMAMYSDDLPDGIDIRFNTNKHTGTPMLGDKDNSVLKSLKDDPDNPFGATIKPIEEGGQRFYTDANGNKQQSVINIVNDEGDWDKWSKTLASQMLSKQPIGLVKQQLKLTYAEKADEYNDILKVSNPVVKRKLLQEFADDCDASAVDLKVSALPRQKFQVILPLTSLNDDEIYAQNFKDGEKVVLIRYPHGGKFEIPELTVNNRNPEGNSVLRNSTDAVGINANVAKKLSGADFDGDTVLVIPNNSGAIKTAPSIKELENFDPKESYKLPDSAPKMKSSTKQMEMGKVTNLISDMTIKGAPISEITRAVRHSMVVIDAEKHHLDYKKSYEDNNIAELKLKYQGSKNAGASTLISLASSPKVIDERKDAYSIDPDTGKKIFTPTNRKYTTYSYSEKVEYVDPKTGKTRTRTDNKKVYYNEKTGQYFSKGKGGKIDILTPEQAKNVKSKTQKAKSETTKMYDTEDAYELSSGTMVENAYASYANKVKALANTARKELLATKDIPYSSSARKTYDNEVKSLVAKLNVALKNAPYERQAQRVANTIVSAKKRSNPDMTKEELKKEKGRALVSARNRVGAKKQTIDISDREWEAIQAGAITTNRLKQIVDNSNMDILKQKATPRSYNAMSDTKKDVAKALAASGWSQADIAERLGVSTSSISAVLKSNTTP